MWAGGRRQETLRAVWVGEEGGPDLDSGGRWRREEGNHCAGRLGADPDSRVQELLCFGL